jgi:protein phosphatase
VLSVSDYRLAPFHILAPEGRTHVNADHVWHMQTLSRLAAADPELLMPTPFRRVNLTDEASEAEATRWWEEMTESGGEDMVVKPLVFVQGGRKDLVQPAVKCRGREYLRIIYGPEYTLEEFLVVKFCYGALSHRSRKRGSEDEWREKWQTIAGRSFYQHTLFFICSF